MTRRDERVHPLAALALLIGFCGLLWAVIVWFGLLIGGVLP